MPPEWIYITTVRLDHVWLLLGLGGNSGPVKEGICTLMPETSTLFFKFISSISLRRAGTYFRLSQQDSEPDTKTMWEECLLYQYHILTASNFTLKHVRLEHCCIYYTSCYTTTSNWFHGYQSAKNKFINISSHSMSFCIFVTPKPRESNKDSDEGMKERLAAAKDESPKSPQRRGGRGGREEIPCLLNSLEYYDIVCNIFIFRYSTVYFIIIFWPLSRRRSVHSSKCVHSGIHFHFGGTEQSVTIICQRGCRQWRWWLSNG